MNIKKLTEENLQHYASLSHNFWTNQSEKNLQKEAEEIINSNNKIAFIYYSENKAIAFSEGSIRHEHVQGTWKSPVGYLECVYVDEDYRQKGIAKKLINKIESWATENGCTQIGSDTEVDNKISQKFHDKLDYKQVKIIIHFVKDLK